MTASAIRTRCSRRRRSPPKRFIAFDMAQIAEQTGSAIFRGVDFRRVCRIRHLLTRYSRATPMKRRSCGGVSVAGSLRAFCRRLRRDCRRASAPVMPPPVTDLKVVAGVCADRSCTGFDALVARPAQNGFPRRLRWHARRRSTRVVDYQDVAYGDISIWSWREAPHWNGDAALLRCRGEIHPATAMAYGDVIRVADLRPVPRLPACAGDLPSATSNWFTPPDTYIRAWTRVAGDATGGVGPMDRGAAARLFRARPSRQQRAGALRPARSAGSCRSMCSVASPFRRQTRATARSHAESLAGGGAHGRRVIEHSGGDAAASSSGEGLFGRCAACPNSTALAASQRLAEVFRDAADPGRGGCGKGGSADEEGDALAGAIPATVDSFTADAAATTLRH